jgi:hypothetical protein
VNQPDDSNEQPSLANSLELLLQYQEAVRAGRTEDADAAAWNLLTMVGQDAAIQAGAEMVC